MPNMKNVQYVQNDSHKMEHINVSKHKHETVYHSFGLI